MPSPFGRIRGQRALGDPQANASHPASWGDRCDLPSVTDALAVL